MTPVWATIVSKCRLSKISSVCIAKCERKRIPDIPQPFKAIKGGRKKNFVEVFLIMSERSPDDGDEGGETE